jgi:hypothetical protein
MEELRVMLRVQLFVRLRSSLFAILLVTALLPRLGAQTIEDRRDEPRRQGPGTGNPDEHLVPWKFAEGPELVHTTPITLYWLPASLQKSEQSPLMRSDALLNASTRCVGLQIILPEQTALLKKLGITDKVAAVVVDRDGKILRAAKNGREIESIVAAELDARDESVYRDLRQAADLATAGNNAAAIALYQKIWDDRCLFSMAGLEAQRALKRLGVIVKEEPKPLAPDPNTQPAAKKPSS